MTPTISNLIDEVAERDLLGWALLGGRCTAHIPTILEECSPDLFGTKTHRDIVEAILHLLEHGIAIDHLEVVQELRQRGEHGITVDYISDLTTGIVFARPVTRRTSYLRDLHNRRKLVALADELSIRACDLTEPLPDLIQNLLTELKNHA